MKSDVIGKLISKSLRSLNKRDLATLGQALVERAGIHPSQTPRTQSEKQKVVFEGPSTKRAVEMDVRELLEAFEVLKTRASPGTREFVGNLHGSWKTRHRLSEKQWGAFFRTLDAFENR